MREVSEVQKEYLDGLSETYSSYEPTTGEGKEAVADLLRLLSFAKDLLQNRNEWQETAEVEEYYFYRLEQTLEVKEQVAKNKARIAELEKLLGICE